MTVNMYTGGDLGGPGALGGLGDLNSTTAYEMLSLANVWRVEGLVQACQVYVVEHVLGPDNAAEWLVWADGSPEFVYGTIRAAALRVVVERPEVLRDAAQAALLQAHPPLLMEAFRALQDGGRRP